MGVNGRISISVIDLDYVAITIVVTALCHRDHAAICRVDRRACPGSNIDAEMPRPVIIAGETMSIGRPGKTSTADSATRTGTLVGGGSSRCPGCYRWHQPLYKFTLTTRYHDPRTGL